MPHVSIQLTFAGEREVERAFGLPIFSASVANLLDGLIRDSGAKACGEKWNDDVRVVIDAIAKAKSLPVAMNMQIAVWANPAAGRVAIVDHTAEFEQLLYNRIRELGFNLPLSISVNAVPNPRLAVDPYDFARDEPCEES